MIVAVASFLLGNNIVGHNGVGILNKLSCRNLIKGLLFELSGHNNFVSEGT